MDADDWTVDRTAAGLEAVCVGTVRAVGLSGRLVCDEGEVCSCDSGSPMSTQMKQRSRFTVRA